MYHRFGENTHPQTNISIEQFESHLAELSKPKYNVLPLPEILRRIKNGKDLPERCVGITIDDAFKSAFTQAYPRLTLLKLPFTLFVATRPVDKNLPDYMDWDQIRLLRDSGVTIGSQTHSHIHMALRGVDESEKDLEISNARFLDELGEQPRLLAYPYGEAGLAIMSLAEKLGFEFAFGQHSGVVHKRSSFYFLPRFAFNEIYGNVERFQLVTNTLPLPVHDVLPRDPLLKENPPHFGFTVDSSIQNISGLRCYHSQQGSIRLQHLGTHRIEVRFLKRFAVGRSRLNCTLLGPSGRWRWFGRQFYTPPNH